MCGEIFFVVKYIFYFIVSISGLKLCIQQIAALQHAEMISRFEYSRVPDPNESGPKSAKVSSSFYAASIGFLLACAFLIFGQYHSEFLPKLRYFSSRGQVTVIQTSLKTGDKLTSLDTNGLSNRGIRVSQLEFGNKFTVSPSAGIGQIVVDSSQRFQVK